MTLTLQQAQSIISACLEWRQENGLKPLTVAVLDNAGALVALAREDNTSLLRPEIAQGKARGAVSMGLGSRALYERAKVEPFFIQAMNALSDGSLVPVAGGVLIKKDGVILGAVGITGDNSDNDEACAIAAIEKAGFVADGG
ncbi:heme-binding protein [Sulfitobacter sp. JBTF-M27]|uniref:Heme-binding protein n=1 Tax=Sulfitobacter sediminilitoris TaxID=2698830 RepID=A0A6P0CCG7_9RHOB|nr:heme-binding protein [Sulfitobacter sediminilitoris]NEK23587.1 heme-binding protein [Sulfitobacter sediminilitoris]